jgi:hypothetical protein
LLPRGRWCNRHGVDKGGGRAKRARFLLSIG